MAEKLKFKRQEKVVLGQVTGDVETEDCEFLVPESGSAIVVKGEISIEGRTTVVEGSLQCERLEIDVDKEVVIEGDLTVATSVHVDKGRLTVKGSAKADRFNVSAALSVGKDLEGKTVTCGGAFKVEGNVKADSIDVGGAVSIGGNVEVEELEVGGSVKCNTGVIKSVDVGGVFKATGKMEIGKLEVGGVAQLGPNSKVLKVDVGGVFKTLGDVTFEELDLGGSAKIEGNAVGKSVDIGGSLKVEGTLTLAESLEVNGAVKIDGDLVVGEALEVNGAIKVKGKLECPTLEVNGAAVAQYIKAEKELRLGRRSEIRGFVEGGIIHLERGAHAEEATLYGDTIRVGEKSRVNSLYGREIYLERDVRVEGEIFYTESLEMERDVELKRDPQKVDKLPSSEKLRK